MATDYSKVRGAEITVRPAGRRPVFKWERDVIGGYSSVSPSGKGQETYYIRGGGTRTVTVGDTGVRTYTGGTEPDLEKANYMTTSGEAQQVTYEQKEIKPVPTKPYSEDVRASYEQPGVIKQALFEKAAQQPVRQGTVGDVSKLQQQKTQEQFQKIQQEQSRIPSGIESTFVTAMKIRQASAKAVARSAKAANLPKPVQQVAASYSKQEQEKS